MFCLGRTEEQVGGEALLSRPLSQWPLLTCRMAEAVPPPRPSGASAAVGEVPLCNQESGETTYKQSGTKSKIKLKEVEIGQAHQILNSKKIRLKLYRKSNYISQA